MAQIVLVVGLADTSLAAMERALDGGGIASVILSPRASDPAADDVLDDASFLARCREAVPRVQDRGAAAIVVDDNRIAGRTGADGLHLLHAGPASHDLRDATANAGGRTIVGVGGVKDRHGAMEAAEAGSDYLFLGPLHRDTHPEPHRKVLALGEWWSDVASVPAIVPAGADVESVTDAARTGADFVAICWAVFGAREAERDRVERARALIQAAGTG